MAKITASFHNEDGTVALEGFFDNVEPLTDLEKQELAARPWDAEADQEQFGVKEWVGVAGYTPWRSGIGAQAVGSKKHNQ